MTACNNHTQLYSLIRFVEGNGYGLDHVEQVTHYGRNVLIRRVIVSVDHHSLRDPIVL